MLKEACLDGVLIFDNDTNIDSKIGGQVGVGGSFSPCPPCKVKVVQLNDYRYQLNSPP